MAPRWHKLLGDVAAAKGRTAIMLVALAASLLALTTVLGARTVLARAIRASYAAGHPAHATLTLEGGVDAAVLAEVRGGPEIADANAREVRMARTRAGGRLQLFVADDLATAKTATVDLDRGAFPGAGELALERSVGRVGEVGDTLEVETSRGRLVPLRIAGIVHDTGLAPSWQERKAYGYVTPATLALLGESPVLHDLVVRFRPEPDGDAAAQAAATALAARLVAGGRHVAEVRVPPLGVHPHGSQMETAQVALLVFALLLLGLGALLVATLLGAMLARQVREIGTMKTLGATRGQIARMYGVYVVAIGAVALAVALPVGALGARAFIDGMGGMMNLELGDRAVPLWVYAAVAAVGLAVPLAAAAVPILGACGVTVRDALTSVGTRGDFIRSSFVRLPMAVRNVLRRPGRFILTAGLLAFSGAVAIAALDVMRGYDRASELLPTWLHADLDVGLAEPAPVALADTIGAVEGVRRVEAWVEVPALLGPQASSAFFVVHTYPDQGHGRFSALGAPPGTTMVTYPVVAGRWLADGDDDAVVLDSIHAEEHGLAVGDVVELTLSCTREPSRWKLVGVVQAIPPAYAYVPAATLARRCGSVGKADLFRIATAGAAPPSTAFTAAVRQAVSAGGARVDHTMPFALLHAAIDAHVVILSRAAVVLAAIVAAVALTGLAAALGVAVAERTREIGTMKAIGATGGQVARLVVAEALLVGAASFVVAAVLAVPLTWGVENVLARSGFLPPVFTLSPPAFALVLAATLAGSAAAALAPARRAARLTVKDALGEV